MWTIKVLHELREESLMSEIGRHVELLGNVTIRDERAVKKTLSAFVKILFPNLEFNKKELEYVVQFTVELRQKVRDWLHKLSPGEFPKETITYRLKP